MICFISDTYMVLKAAGRLAFNILFWPGIREGELLALTRNDFIRRGADEYRLNVNKNFEVVKGTRYILTPKTDSSNRCITIPQFLYYEAVQYFDSLYEPDPDERLFYFTKSYLLNEIKRVAKTAGLNHIRIHNLSYPNLNKIQTFQKKDVNRNKYRLKRFGFYFWCMIPL